MILKNNLYKYKSSRGGEVVSLYEPSCEYEKMYRLYTSSADSILTNGFVFTDNVDIPVRDLDLWREVLKDDLTVDIPQLDIIQVSVNDIKEEQIEQDEAINTSMVAIDLTLGILEGLLYPIGLTGEVESVDDKLVEFYVVMVKRGLKNIESVPEKYIELVRLEIGMFE